MYSTLQSAFGTWPSDKSFDPESEIRHSTVNEGFSFTDEQDDPSPRPDRMIEIQQDSLTSSHGLDIHMTLDSTRSVRPSSVPQGRRNDTATSAFDLRSISGTGLGFGRSRDQPAQKSQYTSVESNNLAQESEDDLVEDQMELDTPPRSPSPTLDSQINQEIDSLWSKDSHKAFHDMVTADGYINRYRMHMKKRQRLQHYLEHPDLDPVLCDGTKDHQTKYQAANWTLIDGKLFRKPEVGRVGKLRRHLDECEAWDVLRQEHVRSGHLGRDKLRKRLEQSYIGYTLQEIMLVLRECRQCSGREKVAVASAPVEEAKIEDAGVKKSYHFGQASNMMLP